MMEFFYEDDHRPASPIHPIEAVKNRYGKDRRPWGRASEIGILEFSGSTFYFRHSCS